MIKKNNIKFIDLDLPSKILWGDRNLGNNKYYMWGELLGFSKSQFVGKEKIFNWDHYRFIKDNKLIKYSYSDKLKILQPGDDVVTQTLGNNYRIPRKEDFEELLEHTKQIYTGDSVIFKSKVNGNQIKFSFSGYASGSFVNASYFNGCLFSWSSSLCEFDIGSSWGIIVAGNLKNAKLISCPRYSGYVIRPLKSKV